MTIQLKRAYEPVEKNDGYRILVDRLWPRGISKEKARIDFWAKDIAPSNELRQWFNHDPKKWATFEEKYKTELQHNDSALQELQQLLHAHSHVTLLFGAKDEEHNNAVVLKTFLLSHNKE